VPPLLVAKLKFKEYMMELNLSNKSWKTSVLGIIGILSAAFQLILQPLLDSDPATVPNWEAFIPALTTGIALMLARDNDKTSKAVGLT
jgi:hypothetical protein